MSSNNLGFCLSLSNTLLHAKAAASFSFKFLMKEVASIQSRSRSAGKAEAMGRPSRALGGWAPSDWRDIHLLNPAKVDADGNSPMRRARLSFPPNATA